MISRTLPRALRRTFPLLAAAAALAAAPRALQEATLLGFTAESSRAQRALEARYDALLKPEDQREWMRRLTRQPFYLGSQGDRQNQDWIEQQLREWGFETRVETFQVLFPTPKERLLEMTAPVRFRARLQEPVLKEDATSAARADQLSSYNAYSPDGDVEGELVYANYGLPADYEELARRGVDVKGKIVIVRYGNSFRGIKPKVAAEHGAIGTLIYSDPRDDGFFLGDAYPKGAYRMEQGVQRGSVIDLPVYTGDPLTPGEPSVDGVRRLSREEAAILPKIPVLPISFGDAQPLLAQLGGPIAPVEWRGALPITYHLGSGPARVHLKLAFSWDTRPARDVIAVLPGAERPDEWVVRGNHADGWAMGAADPISGQVALLAEAKAVGELARTGWKPKRTIVYAAWDGEEEGLLGSTEWVERHADELTEKAVAYVNSDGNGRGFLSAGGSHTLERMVNEIARDVKDPQLNVSVWERLRAQRAVRGDRTVLDAADLRIDPLGSGSDYTPFIQHLGITSLNLSFSGEDGGGSYHSLYDSFDHYTRFIDPDFAYGVTLSKVAGRATLRLADADVVPLRFGNFAVQLKKYSDEVAALADSLRRDTENRNRLVRANAYAMANDPRDHRVAPDSQALVPYLSFAPLQNAVARLERASGAYDDALAKTMAGGGPPGDRIAELNRVLAQAERRLAPAEGLPRRPWYRHQIYAPGYYTGYGVKTMPGIREGLEERKFDEAAAYVVKVAAAIDGVSDAVERAAALLRDGTQQD